jgi:hypothetical protein
MRGQRDKQAVEEAKAAGNAVQIIDVSEHMPRRIPSAKWRELIKKVWEADPLLCPKCQRKMRIVALIDDRAVAPVAKAGSPLPGWDGPCPPRRTHPLAAGP